MILALVTPSELVEWLGDVFVFIEEVDELDDSVSFDVFLPWLGLLVSHELSVIFQISHSLPYLLLYYKITPLLRLWKSGKRLLFSSSYSALLPVSKHC